MSTITSASLSGFYPSVGTGAASDMLLSSSAEERRTRDWSQIIDYKLVEWGRNPIDDDPDTMPPSPLAIRAAIDAARFFREQKGAGAPDWVVTTGDGGVAFQWGDATEKMFIYEFLADGSGELIRLSGSKIVERTKLP